MPAWLNRILLTFCSFVALAVLAGLVLVLVQTRAEYAQVRQTEIHARQRFAEVERKLAEQALVLERLRTDSTYLEMILRRRLGYTKPEEFVFRFDE